MARETRRLQIQKATGSFQSIRSDVVLRAGDSGTVPLDRGSELEGAAAGAGMTRFVPGPAWLLASGGPPSTGWGPGSRT